MAIITDSFQQQSGQPTSEKDWAENISMKKNVEKKHPTKEYFDHDTNKMEK